MLPRQASPWILVHRTTLPSSCKSLRPKGTVTPEDRGPHERTFETVFSFPRRKHSGISNADVRRARNDEDDLDSCSVQGAPVPSARERGE